MAEDVRSAMGSACDRSLLEFIEEFFAIGILQCIGEVVRGPFPAAWPAVWPLELVGIFGGPIGALLDGVVPLASGAEISASLSIDESEQQRAFG